MTLQLAFNDNSFAIYACTCEDFIRYKNTQRLGYKSPTNADLGRKSTDPQFFDHEPGYFPCRHIYARMLQQGVIESNPELVPKDMKVRSLAINPPPSSLVGFNDYGTTVSPPRREEEPGFILGT